MCPRGCVPLEVGSLGGLQECSSTSFKRSAQLRGHLVGEVAPPAAVDELVELGQVRPRVSSCARVPHGVAACVNSHLMAYVGRLEPTKGGGAPHHPVELHEVLLPDVDDEVDAGGEL